MSEQEKKIKPNFVMLSLIILFILCVCIFIAIYFILPNFKALNNSTGNNEKVIEAQSTTHSFENANYLSSDNFTLTVENEVSTINAKIFNNSDKTINDLNCSYILKDNNNNTVYTLPVYANIIEPHSSFGFTSVAILDLSSVVDYSVKIDK